MNERYKIIENKKLIGVALFDELYQWSDMGFLNAGEGYCNIMIHDGTLYHDSDWMRDVPDGVTYCEARVIEIDSDEYEFLFALIRNGQNDLYEEKIVEFKKQAVINKMSAECRKTIERGFDMELSDGTKHFSLTTQDQINLNTLILLSNQLELIPYHADNEECLFFTKSVFNEIAQKATQYITYHVTYFNSLKTYIKSLTTESELDAITYGTEIPNEYKSVVLNTL